MKAIITEEQRKQIENALQLANDLMPENAAIDSSERQEIKTALELVKNLNLPVVSVPLPSDSEIEAAYKEWARLQYEEEALTDTDEWSFKNGFYWLQEFYKRK
jgi:broad specificity phosphatase PhoE